jgi:hypothetical protein
MSDNERIIAEITAALRSILKARERRGDYARGQYDLARDIRDLVATDKSNTDQLYAIVELVNMITDEYERGKDDSG